MVQYGTETAQLWYGKYSTETAQLWYATVQYSNITGHATMLCHSTVQYNILINSQATV